VAQNIFRRQTDGFLIEVARQNLSDVSYTNKYGRNPDIDTGTDPEDIWDAGGLWVAPTQARTHDIASTSANDTSAGTGMRTLRLEGLDENWEEVTEDVALNGTTPVATAHTYQRIFRMYGLTSGSSMTNEGNVTATAQTDATVTAQITAGQGQTFMAIWTVPAGKTAYVTSIYGALQRAAAQNGVAELALLAIYNADTATKTQRFKDYFGLDTDATSFVKLEFEIPGTFPEKTDLIMRCVSVSANDFDVSAGFSCFYE